MTNAELWISTVNAFGYASDKPALILEHYEDIKGFIDDKKNWKRLNFLSDKHIKALKAMNIKRAVSVIEYCDNNDIKIITLDDEEYPVILKRIKNPPGVLYVKGELPDFDNEVGIAMVGTRKSTLSGEIAASTLAYRIAQAGAVIVSGGACGIDSRCSQGAIYAKKPSVIIRPCGIDYNYLNNKKEIRKSVANCGAVISEYEPLEKVSQYAFPARNRLIAALALGVVVVEAPLKSGVMLTVSHALEMGKDVFAIPGDISSENYSGSNKLLHDGATPIYCAADVLNEYNFAFPHKLKLDKALVPLNEDDVFLRLHKKYSKPVKTQTNIVESKPKKQGVFTVFRKKEKQPQNMPFSKKKLDFEADDFVVKVYDCFKGEPLNADQLTRESGLKVSDVLYALTELEINDAITSLPGGRFETK